MPVDRDAVRDTAKYLRSVRPIDPVEIAEYVPEQPDPRVLREVLREEAVSLALIERPDGTFVPVDEGPLRRSVETVQGLPDRYVNSVLDLLSERWGPNWHSGDSGAHLRELIRRLKSEYYRQHSVEYEYHVALAYAVYHLANYYATGMYVFEDMARDGLLPSQLSVLDVGAGVGGPALGLHDLFFETDGEDDPPLVSYTAIEPSDATEILERLLAETDSNFHTRIVEKRAQEFTTGREYDLVCFGNVLSELDSPVSVVRTYLDFLAEDGTLLLLSPADRNTSILLRDVERALEGDDVTVYGPTVRLWPGERPTDTGWSFDRRPDIDPPVFQERLAAGAERPAEFLHTEVKYSYSFLRTDDRTRFDIELSTKNLAKMAQMDRHVSNRIDLIAAKLSHDLATDGHPLFKISDGSEAIDHFAVLVEKTELNRELHTAPYGGLLRFEQVLALWNEDEAAYNLIVDDSTIVDRVG